MRISHLPIPSTNSFFLEKIEEVPIYNTPIHTSFLLEPIELAFKFLVREKPYVYRVAQKYLTCVFAPWKVCKGLEAT
jgi:hypothetical protein